MEFWFCEKCGVRVTATELAKGAVRDTETGVVYCQKCSAGGAPAPAPAPLAPLGVMAAPSKARVTPIVGNAPPAQPATARLVPARGTALRPRETTILRKREASSGRPAAERGERSGSGERASVPLAKKNMPLLVGIGGGVVVLALAGLFLSLGSTPEKKTTDTGAKPAADKPEKKEPEVLARKDPETPAPKPAERAGKPDTAAAASPAILTAREEAKLEAEAQDAFSALENKIKALPDLKSQTAAIDVFLAKYDNCIVAARARTLKGKLKEPQAAQNKTPEPAPAPTAAPAQAAATPEEMQAIVERANAAGAKQDYAGAIAIYDQAITANPNIYQFYQNRANMKLIAGDFEGVIADCDKAIGIQPDWGAYGMKTIATYVLKRQDDYRATLEKAAALKNVTPKALEQLLAAEFQRGLWVLEGKPFETKAPAQPAEFWARGRYRLAFGKTADGTADLHDALKRDATLGPKGIFLDLTNVARSQKDFKEVLNCLKQWAEAKPETAQGLNAYAWELLTCADQSLRDPKSALPLAEKAAELTQKKDVAVLDTLAIAYFYNNRVRTAISTEEKAIELLPADTAPEARKEFERHLSEFKAMEGKDGTY